MGQCGGKLLVNGVAKQKVNRVNKLTEREKEARPTFSIMKNIGNLNLIKRMN